MRRVFLCLPKEDESLYHVLAQHHILEAIQDDAAPFAPSLYAQVLDGIDEKGEGLMCGLAFLQVCDEIWVFGQPTRSMQTELSMALELQITVLEKPLIVPQKILTTQPSNTN
jgi:hypothetical protein